MALAYSQNEVKALAKRATSLQSRIQTVMKKANKYVEVGIRTTIVGGVAFGFGLLNGLYGGIEVVGIPIDLGLAILFHLGGFMGVGGSHAGLLHAAGDGAFASFAFSFGRGVGLTMKDKSKKEEGKSSGEGLSDSDMRAYADAA